MPTVQQWEKVTHNMYHKRLHYMPILFATFLSSVGKSFLLLFTYWSGADTGEEGSGRFLQSSSSFLHHTRCHLWGNNRQDNLVSSLHRIQQCHSSHCSPYKVVHMVSLDRTGGHSILQRHTGLWLSSGRCWHCSMGCDTPASHCTLEWESITDSEGNGVKCVWTKYSHCHVWLSHNGDSVGREIQMTR